MTLQSRLRYMSFSYHFKKVNKKYMNINLSAYLITGCMLGFEHVHLDGIHYIVIDILFVRLTVEIEKAE